MAELSVIPVAEPAAELPAEPSGRAPLHVRAVILLVIVVPFLGLVAAPFFLWGWGFAWTDLGLLVGMYLASALGITVGFHRLFVHRYLIRALSAVGLAWGVKAPTREAVAQAGRVQPA